MQWIARGLLHLLLYRFVYMHLTIPDADIRDAGDLARSMFATFLLYLRVSGQFHLAVGILHLYGFHLPETHKLYYLASSFTDFWRRINIYWKDFMVKLVYYPSYFRLRRYGVSHRTRCRNGYRFSFHLVAAFLPVVLAPGWLSADGAGRSVLGSPWCPCELCDAARNKARPEARAATFKVVQR